MGKHIGKNISENLCVKHSLKLLIMLKNLPQMDLKMLQKINSRNSRGKRWFDNKIANRITKVSKTSQQSNSYISRGKTEKYWLSNINIIV